MFLGTVKRQTIPDRHRDCLLFPGVKMPEVEIGTETHPRRAKAQLDAPNGISQVISAACSILQFDVLTFARSQHGYPVFSGMFYVPDVTVCRLSALLSTCFSLFAFSLPMLTTRLINSPT